MGGNNLKKKVLNLLKGVMPLPCDVRNLFWLAYGAGNGHVTVGGVVSVLGVLAAFKNNGTKRL